MALAMLNLLWPLAAMYALAISLERAAPRSSETTTGLRLTHGAALYMMGVLAIIAAAPIAKLSASTLAAELEIGLLNIVAAPWPVAVAVGVLALDLGEWMSHRILHAHPVLWRAHRLHHDDERLDASTAVRFHPFDLVLRYLIGVALVLAFGVPATAILVAMALTLAMNAWQHADARTPRWVAPLSAVLVTPDMHRLHHSDDPTWHSANFGVVFSLWDRLFGTLRANGPKNLRFGLGDGAEPTKTLGAMLADPFRTR